MTRDDKEREVKQRLKEIGPLAPQLVPILDDWQLDLLLLALGLGEVVKK